jgi:hypothetical protein
LATPGVRLLRYGGLVIFSDDILEPASSAALRKHERRVVSKAGSRAGQGEASTARGPRSRCRCKRNRRPIDATGIPHPETWQIFLGEQCHTITLD